MQGVWLEDMSNKYGAIKSYSELCGRGFDSIAERRRGEELHMLQLAGEITDLQYQVKFKLCDKPKITYTADFQYIDRDGKVLTEDVKGVLTRDTRTKIAWVREKFDIEVILVR